MYKTHLLPDPQLQRLNKNHLLALIDRTILIQFDTSDIAKAVYDVETRYVHDWMNELVDGENSLKEMKSLDRLIKHTAEWGRMMDQDKRVHEYWEKWIAQIS